MILHVHTCTRIPFSFYMYLTCITNNCILAIVPQSPLQPTIYFPGGGYSHRLQSCDHNQNAVKGSRPILMVGQTMSGSQCPALLPIKWHGQAFAHAQLIDGQRVKGKSLLWSSGQGHFLDGQKSWLRYIRSWLVYIIKPSYLHLSQLLPSHSKSCLLKEQQYLERPGCPPR